MSEAETAWLAGWLEGEGSFIVTSGRSRNKRYKRVRINACSTDLDTLEYVQALVGGVVNGPYIRTGGGGKPVYAWSLSTYKSALPVMQQVEPYMISAKRKNQIRAAIEAAESLVENGPSYV